MTITLANFRPLTKIAPPQSSPLQLGFTLNKPRIPDSALKSALNGHRHPLPNLVLLTRLAGTARIKTRG